MKSNHVIFTLVFTAFFTLNACTKKDNPKGPDANRTALEGTWDFTASAEKYYRNDTLIRTNTVNAPLTDTSDFDYPAQLIFSGNKLTEGYFDGKIVYENAAKFSYTNNLLIVDYGNNDVDSIPAVIAGDNLKSTFKVAFEDGGIDYRFEADVNYKKK